MGRIVMQLPRIMAAIAALTFGAVTFATAVPSEPLPVQSVAMVDQSHWMGRWYQIARLPNRFQKGCIGAYTDFSLRDDGQINVINSCKNEKDGSLRQEKGRAWVIDPVGNARIKVSFFWPFRSEYWVIGLGKDYEYSVVASPNRKYLWVLSRTPTMSDDFYVEIMKEVERQGFDTKKVIKEIPMNRTSGNP
jgi:apolipoprotein D and lipocalin family protein